MSKEEFEGRPDCKDMQNGHCGYGTRCRFRHPGDPTIMTEEMQRNCVHRRSNVGVVTTEVDATEDIVYGGGGGGRPCTPGLE